MVVIVDLADRKGNLGVEYMRKMSEGGRGGGGEVHGGGKRGQDREDILL